MTEDLKSRFDLALNTPSDINEHMGVLLSYARLCRNATEFGVRDVVSTWAFLRAELDWVCSYDPYRSPHVFTAERVARENGLSFAFIQANDLEVEIAPTDLLFIDTLHTYQQLKQELTLHGKWVLHYIIMHDTVFAPELMRAIDEFIKDNPNWVLHEHRKNNNGLTVIRRA